MLDGGGSKVHTPENMEPTPHAPEPEPEPGTNIHTHTQTVKFVYVPFS